MNPIAVLSLLLLASSAIGQEVEPVTIEPATEGTVPPTPATEAPTEAPTEPPVSTSCYSGLVTNGEGNITEISCDFERAFACQTKIEQQTDFLSFTYDCKQLQACENNAANNVPKCYPGENGVRLCWFCCQSDNCNDFVAIPEVEA